MQLSRRHLPQIRLMSNGFVKVFAVADWAFRQAFKMPEPERATRSVTEAFDLPNIQIVDPFSVSDAPGDNDGFPEAGEKVFLNVSVTNQTGDAMTNAFVNADGGTNVNLGTIANGQTVQAQILYKIPRNTPCGGFHQVTLNAGSDVGNKCPF